jgi:outer membrane protein OmpA-like peptidoglycan-associated protein
MPGLNVNKTVFLRLAAVFAVAMSTSACSMMPDMPSAPDWIDPTTWFGDDSSDTTSNAAQPPDLASVPDKPAASTSDDQKQVAESLAADRSHAKYDADALRGGTEASAAPPPPMAPATAVASMPAPAAPTETHSAPVQQTAQVDRSVAADQPTGSSIPGALPAPSGGVSVASAPIAPPPAPPAAETAQAEQPMATPAPVAQAEQPAMAPVAQAEQPAMAPAPGAQPAMPAAPVAPQQVATVAPSDAALGFKPSTAPPLDPSISQFVAPMIVAHYERTASNAGIAEAPRVASVNPGKLHRPMGEGGPDKMSGAVVANLDVIPTTSAPAIYTSQQGVPATAVVFFPGDSVGLNEEARMQVRAAVERYKSGGGHGYIRVVGHSASRTPDMSVERHLEVILKKSQERADAVAKEIIREGVPAAKVLVDAVGDSQPIYYESMPKGEDGNRRAEIFLEG